MLPCKNSRFVISYYLFYAVKKLETVKHMVDGIIRIENTNLEDLSFFRQLTSQGTANFTGDSFKIINIIKTQTCNCSDIRDIQFVIAGNPSLKRLRLPLEFYQHTIGTIRIIGNFQLCISIEELELIMSMFSLITNVRVCDESEHKCNIYEIINRFNVKYRHSLRIR